MKRREFLRLNLALGASVLAPKFAFGNEKFTVFGAPALPSLMIGIALKQGKIAQIYDTNLEIWRTPDQLRVGVASGEYQVMMSPANVGVNLQNQGQNVGMIDILTGGLSHILSKNAKISALHELENKKMIMPFKNDMPDIVLKALFKKLGVNADKIDITYTMAPSESAEMFLMRDFDFAFLPEPVASACVLKGQNLGVDVKRNLDISQIWGDAFGVKPMIPQAGIIANRDFFAAKKADFEILHEDLKIALSWIKENPNEAANFGANLFAASQNAIETAIPNANLCVYKASEIRAEIEKFFEIIMEFNPKLLGGALPKDDFFLC